MPPTPKPFFVAGRAQTSPTVIPVIDKNRGGDAVGICVPGAEAVERAIEAAAAAAEAMRQMPAYRRHDALIFIARRLRERSEEIAKALVVEVGKPIFDARTEVSRAIDTIRAAAEESPRFGGEFVPLDSSPRGENFEAVVKRVPVGPCTFITPFNFPLNLACHKIGPALAVGCPFILKPDPRTPLSSLILGEVLAEADLPTGAFSILPVVDDAAREQLIVDDRIRLISFTGSTEVGWSIRQRAPKKKVTLELGGVAFCILDAPVSRSDLERIADRMCTGAYSLAGQSCISVQRILVHSSVHEQFLPHLLGKIKSIKVGDPREETTQMGPMISVESAERVEHWIEEAKKGGGRVLAGGQRVGAFVDPTLIENAPASCRLASEEVFGPVATVQKFDSFDEALGVVNSTRFGLQTGVFTASLSHAFRAWNVLDVGAVVINDVPSTRIETMPYGGVKDSGTGREGVRYAMQEMTEMRALVLKNVGKPRSASSERKGGGDSKPLTDTKFGGDAKTLADTRNPGETE
ncbi:MAG: aldehyde dehydrogenase family protein [Phycisphaerae bacterium]|nr:aldehyde dehydrogenase family protein [Phycisphaerae bacterium]